MQIPGFLRKRGNRWHYCLYLNGKLWERSTGETNKERAKAKAKKLYELAQSLRNLSPDCLRLSGAIVKEVARIEQSVGKSRAERVSSALENLYRFTGDIFLEKLTAELLAEYQTKRIAHAGRYTVVMEVGTILRMLKQNGITIQRPELPEAARAKFTEVRCFSRPELIRFFNHVPDRLRCLCALLLVTGSRLPELVPSSRAKHVPLLKTEVNLKERTVLIRSAKRRSGASKKPRLLRLPSEIIPMLEKQMRDTPGQFVFKRIHNLRRDFEDILRRANIKKYNAIGEKLIIHSFRHTYGTLMAEMGLSSFGLKEIMGHSKLSTTERYIHPSAPVVELPFITLTREKREVYGKNLWQSEKEGKEKVAQVL